MFGRTCRMKIYSSSGIRNPLLYTQDDQVLRDKGFLFRQLQCNALQVSQNHEPTTWSAPVQERHYQYKNAHADHKQWPPKNMVGPLASEESL